MTIHSGLYTTTIGLALYGLSATAQAATPELSWEDARAFGYVVGDTFTLNARAQVPDDWQLEIQQLPASGRTSDNALEVRQVRWQRLAPALYRVSVEYQIFTGVQRTENLTLAPLTLHFQASDGLHELSTPPWSLAVAAQIPSYVSNDDVQIRPPQPLTPPSLRAPLWGLAVSLSSAVLAGLWLAWLNDYLPGTHRAGPFTRACRALRRESDALTALRILHRAFAETAGGAVFAAQIDAFLAERPAYQALAEEIRAFHTASRQVFFAEADAAAAFSLARIRALSRACQHIERSRPWA